MNAPPASDLSHVSVVVYGETPTPVETPGLLFLTRQAGSSMTSSESLVGNEFLSIEPFHVIRRLDARLMMGAPFAWNKSGKQYGILGHMSHSSFSEEPCIGVEPNCYLMNERTE